MRARLKKLLFVSAILFIALWWFYVFPTQLVVSYVAVLLLSAVFPVNRWTFSISVGLALLAVCRVVTAHYVRSVVILPNDFEGIFTVVEHPSGTGKIEMGGLWKLTVTLRVPQSGLLVVSDKRPLHYWRDDEEWRYEDGRVLKRWNDQLSPGVTKATGIFNGARGAAPDDPLYEFRDKNEMVNMLQFELRRERASNEPRPNQSLEQTASPFQ